MALTGLIDNTKFLRTDKNYLIQGANYGSGKLVIDGRYDYQPLNGLSWDDETAQICNTNFVANYSRRIYEVADGSVALVENQVYSILINSDTTFVLPQPKNKAINNEIMVMIKHTGGSVNYGTDLYIDGEKPVLDYYSTIYYDYDPLRNNWVVGSLSSGGEMMLPRKIYTVSGSHVFSEKLKRAIVYCVGGGGTSGNVYRVSGHRNRHAGVNGGGAGGYCKKLYKTELQGKTVNFAIGNQISARSTVGQDTTFLGQRAYGGGAGIAHQSNSGVGGQAIGGDENYQGNSGAYASVKWYNGNWPAGHGKGGDGVELFGIKYGRGGGCGSCTHCGSYVSPYNTTSGGGCVIIEEWVAL